MANLSDAFGDIKVKKVGKEFVEFLNEVQGKDAYYLLAELDAVNSAELDSEGNLEFGFATAGRWSYTNNIEGYLNGYWMDNSDALRESYKKLVDAIKLKDGSITIEYSDSDWGMDWMGKGVAELSADNGEICFSNNFDDERITLSKFADMNGEDEYWALAYVYGDEVAEQYDDYVEKWEKDHSGPECEGMDPAGPSEWYDNEYQEEQE